MHKLIAIIIIGLFLFSSIAFVIPDDDNDKSFSSKGAIDTNDLESLPEVDDVDRASDVNTEDSFRVYEIMYPEEEEAYTDEYYEFISELQERNLKAGYGNSGPSWNEYPGIDGSDLDIPRMQTRAMPTPVNDKLIVILINFTDSDSDLNHTPVNRDTDHFNESVVFNSTAGANTMVNYLEENSYNTYNLTGEIAKNSSAGNTNGWYTASHDEKYYGYYELNTSSTIPPGWGNAKDLVTEAVQMADADINFSNYDLNKDGFVDHLMIIHAGADDAADGGGGPFGDPQIWSHRGGQAVVTNDGVWTLGYTMLAERSVMGVYAHEYGHDMGLPDLYNTLGGADPVKKWDIMGGGAYNTYLAKNTPSHFSSWGKEQLGWHDPIVINETNNNQGIKTVRATTEMTNENTSFKINLPNSQQWYYVENRYRNLSSYDAGLPESGIVIWHFDKSVPNNNGNPKRLVPENASTTISDLSDAAWSLEDNQILFNSSTTPSTSYNNGTPTRLHMDMINNSGSKQRIRILLSDDVVNPGVPTITSISDIPNDNGNELNVTWTRSADDGIGVNDVKYYNLYMNDTGQGPNGNKHIVAVITADDSPTYTFILSGIPDRVTYHFSIRADDGPNESPWSNNVSAMALDNKAESPTGLVVTDRIDDDGGNISLSWSLSPDDALDIVGYNISMNDTGQGSGGSKHLVATLLPGTTTYNAANLTNGLDYYFNVSAFDEVYNIGYSNEDTAQPVDDWVGFPTNLAPNPSSWTSVNSFTLTWNNPQDNAGIVGVYYKLDAMPLNPTDGTNVPGADITTTIVTVVGGGNHTVYIWLEDGQGNIEFMNWAATNLYYDGYAPGAPLNANVTPSGWTNVNSFDINWTNPSDLTGIKGVYYTMDTPPTSPTDGVLVTQPNIEKLTAVSVLDDSNVHPTWLWLIDGINNMDHLNSSMVTLKYDATAPAAPVNLQTSPWNWTKVNNFTLTWTNPQDLSGVVAAYYKLDQPPLSSIDGIRIDADDLNRLDEVMVGYDGTHTVYVWLVDNATNTNHINSASTNLYYDSTPPSAPDNLKVVPASWSSSTDFAITWTNPGDISSIGGIFYKIGSMPTANDDGVYTPGYDITELTQVSVTQDGVVRIYLWLNDTAGNTDWKNFNVTIVYRDSQAPGKPLDLAATPGSWTNNNNFSIEWNNPAITSGIKGAYYKLDSPPTSNFDGSLVLGPDIEDIGVIQVAGNGEHMIYVWLIDVADNIDFNNYNTTVLSFDDVAPAAPSDLVVDPVYWSSDNDFMITWTNPSDMSGIAGVYHKIGSRPNHVNDGTFVAGSDITELKNIRALTQGISDVYLWLKDSAGNYDDRNNATIQLQWDNKPPVLFHTKVEAATTWVAIDLYATINDVNSNVRAAYLFYKTDTDVSYSTLPMIQKGNMFEVSIPEYKVTENSISYFLMAIDNAEPANFIYFGKYGSTTTNITAANDIDIAITDDDLAPPTISHVPVNTGTEGKAIEITAMVHDDASGISSVLIYYKRTSEEKYWTKAMTKSYSYYTVVIDGSIVRTEGLEYYLKAVDSAPAQNKAYFGFYGQSSLEPNSVTDIDVVVTDTDTTPPIITFGPVVTSVTENKASILWRTDEPADGRTEWGFSSVYADSVFDATMSNEHWVNLTGLDAETLYHFRVSSTDAAGNGPTYSNDFTFTTLKPGVVDTDGDGIPDPEDVDDDNDGMKDDWEEKYNFDPKDFTDADDDVDYDGYSNRAEYFFGTDPWDPRSTPVGQSDIGPPIISHTPVHKSKIGEAITITAEVYDDGSGVKEVALYYRVKGASNYTKLNMGNKTPFMAMIPATETVNVDILEYYIFAVDFGYNIAYYGKLGQADDLPTTDNDIDILLKEQVVSEDDTIWDTIGEPFGVTDAGTCILLLIILIVVLIAVGYGIARASRKHDDKDRERESEERFAQREREMRESARRTGAFPGDVAGGRGHPGRWDERGRRQPDVGSMYQDDYRRPVKARAQTPAAPMIDFKAPKAAPKPVAAPKPKSKAGPKDDSIDLIAPDRSEGEMEYDEEDTEEEDGEAVFGPGEEGAAEEEDKIIYKLDGDDEETLEKIESRKRWDAGGVPPGEKVKKIDWTEDDAVDDPKTADKDDDDLDEDADDLDDDLDDDDFDVDDDDIDDFDDE